MQLFSDLDIILEEEQRTYENIKSYKIKCGKIMEGKMLIATPLLVDRLICKIPKRKCHHNQSDSSKNWRKIFIQIIHAP